MEIRPGSTTNSRKKYENGTNYEKSVVEVVVVQKYTHFCGVLSSQRGRRLETHADEVAPVGAHRLPFYSSRSIEQNIQKPMNP